MSKSERMVSEIEEMLAVRLRPRHPDVDRVGIECGPRGWTSREVSLVKSAKTATRVKKEELLAEANFILAELQKHFEIVDR
ncbi:MAG: hypothetical protein JO108_12120 [Acidobacteriaceae bacterium]|nr:hypothetical protein [Acidobacteriaceae bacterium]